MDDLQKWELIDDSWSMNYGNNEPVVWLEPPFKREVSATLRASETLIFLRSFEGFDTDKNYYELLQKFAHIFNLHYVPHKRAYCELDENGDVRSVVRTINLPEWGAPRGGTVIVASRRYLDEYLLISDAIAMRAFDFTRYGKTGFLAGATIGAKPSERTPNSATNWLFNLASAATCVAFRSCVRSNLMAQLHYRLTHAHEATQYRVLCRLRLEK